MARIIDEVSITVKAGNGGKGCESRTYINEVKFLPTGGEGGQGGSVSLKADVNVTSLKPFLYQRHFEAEAGGPGGSNHKRGKKGHDLVIAVPCGTTVFEKTKHFLLRDLVSSGEEFVVAQGGKGGVGNEGKKEAKPGETGQILEIILRLKIPSDVFLVGLPNTGKSKLLNRLTGAHSKEETYPFSTKHPELGVYQTSDYEKIHLCELPPIYRDSPIGHGVGYDFLKHLGRAKLILLMLAPLNAFASSLQEGHEILLQVLKHYAASNPPEMKEKSILEIPRVVVVNKMDLKKARLRLEKEKFHRDSPLFLISAETGEGVEVLMRYVAQQMKEYSNA